MKSRFLRRLVPIAAAAVLSAACGPIDLGEETDGDGSKPSARGSEIAPEDTASVAALSISVDEARRLPLYTEVVIRGYVVGYAAGTTLSSARFDIPEDKANTNLLIADSPRPAEAKDCMPLKLVTTGDNPRAALNHYDHPEHLGRQIVVSGWLDTYFKVRGLTAFRYFWTDRAADGGQEDNPKPPAGETPALLSGSAVMEGR